MPNIIDDGLLDQATVSAWYSKNPTNVDYNLQSAVGSAINVASSQGLFTCTVNISAYTNSLVQSLIERLVNMGYTASMPSSTTLTVSWSNVI